MKDWNDDVLLLKRVNEKRETKIGYDDLRKEKGQFKEEKISYEKDRMIEILTLILVFSPLNNIL